MIVYMKIAKVQYKIPNLLYTGEKYFSNLIHRWKTYSWVDVDSDNNRIIEYNVVLKKVDITINKTAEI